ncbi:hypothetical protein FNO01nite_33200 [Flavobacterium noncentrifugens]|uniref:Transcriptional regulator MntR n=1 Tax=Flavobacterium noncentrifugens TaxID=1128970 RepID=A0A1G8ZNE4_9FLAO|nr:metal-dependent transcriptional regulator [Flavobacterium noncentrifugens]GEP52648.1 hypothetical protein FNO01nite_33200 [Flavobacterium noncentrifugens]SDK15670.1 iron (metal) dependent repressor, DtxR family [Flavobacterium noncentrifugens]
MTPSEQEYLKQIYLYTHKQNENVSTNALALLVSTKASSVTDMVKKLAAKDLVVHNPYYGTSLSESGEREAIIILRRYLFWQLLLVRKLKIENVEAAALATQLQAVNSDMLSEKLFAFLDCPRHDIFGKFIPGSPDRK